MCQFCHEHGEGKKWYLNVRNYAEELATEVSRRKFLNVFFRDVVGEGHAQLSRLERIFGRGKGRRLPGFIRNPFLKKNKPVHFGQVLPLEDVAEVFSMATTITRMPCGCRFAAGKREERVCYGVTIGAHEWYRDLDMDYFGRPDLMAHEVLDRETAMEQMTALDRKGLIHSVWTFVTPFIGGICNCDNADGCLAMRSTYGQGLPMLFRAEVVARTDPERCSGCRKCEKLCPVLAVRFDRKQRRCGIDPARCYGCGVCRAVCDKAAIALLDRREDPVADRFW